MAATALPELRFMGGNIKFRKFRLTRSARTQFVHGGGVGGLPSPPLATRVLENIPHEHYYCFKTNNAKNE